MKLLKILLLVIVLVVITPDLHAGFYPGNLQVITATGTPATTTYDTATNTKVYFVIGSTLIHTVTAAATHWTSTMNFHGFMSNVNVGNTTDVTLMCRALTISRLGPLLSQATSYRQSGTTTGVTLKRSAGNLHRIIISNITNSSIVTLYDGTSTGGTILFYSGQIPVGQGTPGIYTVDLGDIAFSNGLFLTITGTNSDVVVSYE